jgi:hypothetical protein
MEGTGHPHASYLSHEQEVSFTSLRLG